MAMSAPAVSLPAPDDSLIAGLRAGDRGAVSRAYEAHHAVIRSFAQRLVGDPGAAEDIVHDTFVALPRAIGSFRGDASLRTFLIGVAVNHAKRHVRSAVRRRAAMSRLAEDPGSSPAAVRDPEQEAARRQLADRLWKALDALPLDQRVALVLCEVEQRTSTEVAAIVGVPEGTVRTRLFHAKRKMRAALGEEA
jgi:RNA polymerase sigma-70 factor (ECF subfamily)